MGRFRQEMRKHGVWLRHADAERMLAILKKQESPMVPHLDIDERELIRQFEDRVKEMR